MHWINSKELNSNILGHISPKYCTGKYIADSILEFLEDREYKTNHLNFTALRCVGTVLNTGHSKGTLSLIEKKLGRTLEWLTFLFFCNKLQLWYMFC